MPDVPDVDLMTGDVTEMLDYLPDKSVQCCVTSPPYWGLRDYKMAGQIGLEPTPQAYIDNLVLVFNQVRRVLKDDGTLWLNLGDSYASGGCGSRDSARWSKQSRNDHPVHVKKQSGCKPKDLIGIPWRTALALQDDGWYLRSDIIWANTRNKRDVWWISPKPFKGAHFAVFPPDLVEPCILAGSSAGSTVLDPFCGRGTCGVVALRHGRNFVGIELNPEYVEIARTRIASGV